MLKIRLFLRGLALALSIVMGFFSGFLPVNKSKYYTAEQIAAYTSAAEAAYPRGMIILIGGGFDTDETFRPIAERCISHVGKQTPRMLFVPTAQRDELEETEPIISRFAAAGCETDVLLVSKASVSEVAAKFAWADIIYATGGSLKFLTENWSQKGVYQAAEQALIRGAVLLGVSSGAMCWARRGWDDTEPDVLRNIAHPPFVGMASGFAFYDCAGLLPFCVTPHFDSIGWRSYYYEAANASCPSLCIENGAALVYDGGVYSILSDAKTPTRSVYLFHPEKGIRFLNFYKDASLAAVVDGEMRALHASA